MARLELGIYAFGSDSLILDRKHDKILRRNLLDIALGIDQLGITSPTNDTYLIRDSEDCSRSHRLILSMNYERLVLIGDTPSEKSEAHYSDW
jgi:hypothetical protein